MSADIASLPIPSYFVIMIDHGRRGREAIVDPEITRRGVVSRIAAGEYRRDSILFIQHVIHGSIIQTVTDEIMAEVEPFCEEAA